MKTTILLIRHGQTDWNVSRRWQGHKDISLNELGLAQSSLLAKRLTSWPIKAIHSSDLSRAAQTAAIIGDALNIVPVLDPSWRERNGGEFQGMTVEELETNHPVELKQMRENGLAPPGGESNIELEERIVKAYNNLVQDYAGQMVAVVSHGGSLAALIAHILGFPPGKRARITLRGNTSLSIVEINDFGPRITLLNDTSHLTSLEKEFREVQSFSQV